MPKMHNVLRMLIILKIFGAPDWQQSISYFDVVAGLKDAWHNNKWITAIHMFIYLYIEDASRNRRPSRRNPADGLCERLQI